MKAKTIDNILEVGANLILKEGYNNVGLNKILTTANIPKGSFYYYFKNKEDFGLQVIQYYSSNSLSVVKACLAKQEKTPKERIISFFEQMQQVYTEKEYKEGCLLGNCSLELSDSSDSFSKSIAIELDKWQSCFEECIREGQADGSIKADESAHELSDLVFTSWEGALLRMKSAKNTDSITIFIKFLRLYLL